MQEHVFRDAVEMIYATFGRVVPSGAIVNAIRTRVAHIPDEAAPWIVAKICDEATLPQNPGRAISMGWDAWQAAHPQRVAKEQCPAWCDSGFRHCWAQRGGRWMHFVSPCPDCREGPRQLELESRGVVVMPNGFKGGPLAFDRQNGFGALNDLRGAA